MDIPLGRESNFGVAALEREIARLQDELARAYHRLEQLHLSGWSYPSGAPEWDFNRAIIDSFPANIAVLDPEGVVVAVNRPWLKFGEANGGISDRLAAGVSYVDVCSRAGESGDEYAGDALAGIRSVLTGASDEFSMEYPCCSPSEERWYLMTVVKMRPGTAGAMVIHRDISNRKKIESGLCRSEARYRALIQAVPSMTFEADAHGSNVFSSEQWTRYTGLSQEETAGFGWAKAIHPDDRALSEHKWKKGVQECSAIEMRHRLRAKDGSYRWFLIRSVPIKDAYGRIESWLGSATDIHELVEAEEVLQRQAALIDLSPDAIIVRGTADTITFWSGGAEELYGWRREEALEQEIHTLLRTEFPEPLERILQIVERKGRWTGELVQKRRNGDIIVVQSYWLRSFRGEEGVILESNVDITERKNAERALRESTQRLAMALDGGQMGTWEWDIPENKAYWNPKEYELLGVEPSVGPVDMELFLQRLHPEDLEKWKRDIAFVLHGGSDWEGELRVFREDGDVRWLAGRGRVERDESGAPIKMFGVNYDITDRKLAEERLSRAKADAERASAVKDRFLATLSHELRTPLNPILMASQLLQRRNDLPEAVRNNVAVIHRNVQLEARLIDDLLDLTRLVHGKVELRVSEVDLHAVIRAAVDVCLPKASEKEINVVLLLEAKRSAVSGDYARLQQVFWNVLINAIKFTGQKGSISVETRDTMGDEVVAVVRDTGAGIDAAFLPKLFDAFEQGGDGHNGGLGLGLAITKSLVSLHQGRIEAASEGRGHGASFTITLPALQAPVKKAEPAVVEPITRATSRRVLVVEDHDDTAQLLRLALENRGHVVTRACTMASALECATEKFDVLLCDIGLPDGSGLDVLAALTTKPRFCAALTGYGSDDDVRRSREAGFHIHLTKPVDIELVERFVEQPFEDESGAQSAP